MGRDVLRAVVTIACLLFATKLTAVTDASGNIVLQNPLPGTRGSLGQNSIEMPGTWTFDSGIGKGIKLPEARVLTLRIDATNIFNHPQPSNPSFDINSPLPFGNIATKTGNRALQAQVRLDF